MALRPTFPWPSWRVSSVVPTKHVAPLMLGLLAAMLVVAALPATVAAGGNHDNRFVQTNLVSDVPGAAQITDPSLVNAWGMSFGPTTPIWVSNNGSDSTTLYKGDTLGVPFAKVPLTVAIPDGAPTGQVFNAGADFMVGGVPAKFIFASEHGFIDAWQPGLGTTAMQVATPMNAEYKGLAISTGSGGSWLYAANFKAGRIDVFNGSWVQQSWPGAFKDRHIPSTFAPFNIQNLGGRLYVTYAKVGPTGDDVSGLGHGFVDVYTTTGHLIRRLVTHGLLNSPWGLQIAPAGFGKFGGDLLVGNFGDGRIHAYSRSSGKFEGTLLNTKGKPLAIDGLWGLQFGNGVAGTPMTLIFSAGPKDESHGLVGTLTLAPDSKH